MKRNIAPIVLFLFSIAAFSQPVFNKVGGVAFRVDDHQLAYKWQAFDSIFNKYGYKFSLGLDAQRILSDAVAYDVLKKVSANGHEIMDHSPSGTLAYIAIASNNKKDTLNFYGKPGVDHINGSMSRVCLEIDTVYTENITGEGLVNMYGNMIISQDNGAFGDMYSPAYKSNLYFPTKDFVATWYNLASSNPNDPDTLLIRSYWQEPLTLDTVLGIPYHKLTGYDIKMSEDALKMLVERSLHVYDSLGFPRPVTWVQPGGAFAQLTKQEVKDLMGAKYGFNAGATYQGVSYKMYNEVDSLNNKRFAVQNPDINEESSDFKKLISTIANNSARHLHSFTLGHFYNPLGGWDGYINRVDSLLNWCMQNNIPVRTVNEWAHIMFDSMPNPYANAIPELYRDIDYDGLPDGLTGPFAPLDSTGGVARSKGWQMHRTNNGNFFAINIMGGAEKGWNRFSIYTKGDDPKDSVRLFISFPEIAGSNRFYNLAANTPDWKEVSTLVYIDPRASRVNIQLNALRGSTTGEVHISGVQMRKPSAIQVKKGYKNSIVTDHYFGNISTGEFVIDSAYQPGEYHTEVEAGSQLKVSLDSVNGIVTIRKPSMFWVGTDSIKMKASNGDNTSDSAYLVFEAHYPTVCEGSSYTIHASSAFGSGFSWFDGSSVTVADSLVITPSVARWYYVSYTDNNNDPNAYDSIWVGVDGVKPTITLTNDTLICKYDNFFYVLPDAGDITWYWQDNRIIDVGPSLNIVSIPTPERIYIINKIGSCTIKDTLDIDIRPIEIISQKLFEQKIQKGTSAGFSLVVPSYATVTQLNTPTNSFVYQGDSIAFTPDTSYVGVDSAVYLISDGLCAFDTVTYKVDVTDNVSVKEIAKNTVKIYPNPAQTQLTIETGLAGTVTVYTVLGQAVLTAPLTEGRNEISIAGLDSGLYTMLISGGDSLTYKKVVKQ